MTVGPFSLPDSDSSVPPPTVDDETGQDLSNYTSPSSSDNVSELNSKLSSQGSAASFTTAADGTSLVQSNGTVYSQDDDSGDTTAVGTYSTTSLPANAVPSSAGDNTTNWKVKLVATPTLGNDTVVFQVAPQITESQSAQYQGVGVIQHPGEILKYETTKARGFNLEVTLVSRNSAEATANQQTIDLIRSWTMPFYGTGTNSSYPTNLGGPPQILTLSGYGDSVIPPTPCILETWSWVWDQDVNWVPTSNNTPFPVIMKLTMSLKEARAPSEFSAFDLQAYRQGNIVAAFGGASSTSPGTSTSPSVAGASPSGVDVSQATTASTTQDQSSAAGPAATSPFANQSDDVGN